MKYLILPLLFLAAACDPKAVENESVQTENYITIDEPDAKTPYESPATQQVVENDDKEDEIDQQELIDHPKWTTTYDACLEVKTQDMPVKEAAEPCIAEANAAVMKILTSTDMAPLSP